MAKDRKPAEELSGLAEKTMEQARTAVDTYFDYLKKAIFIDAFEWNRVR